MSHTMAAPPNRDRGQSDTSLATEQVVLDAIRRTDPVQRMREALALSESMRAVALNRLRTRYPDRTLMQLVELMLGEPLCGGAPPDRAE